MAGPLTNRFAAKTPGSAWKDMEARREKSKAYREQFEAMSAATNSALSSANADKMFEAGNLAAKAAVKRIEDATAAKVAKNQADEAKNRPVYRNKEPVTEVSAGKATVNFASDTLTLSDGTQIDIKTGVKKKVDVTV